MKTWEKPEIIEEQNKMEYITEQMADYVCGELCTHRLESQSESELEVICDKCKMHGYVNDIQYVYDEINSIDRSQSLQLMRKYSGFVRCSECEYLRTNEYGQKWCNNIEGMTHSYLTDEDGCARGKLKTP